MGLLMFCISIAVGTYVGILVVQFLEALLEIK